MKTSGVSFSGAATSVIIVFLLLPILVVVASSVSATGYMTFPPANISFRWFIAFLESPEWLLNLGVTFLLSLIASAISVAVGLAAALVLTRRSVPGKRGIELLILLPLIFPHVALALAILAVVNKMHLLGTFSGVLFAHILVTLPFAYRPIAASLSRLDSSAEEAAMSLGAPPWTTFRRVTLPLIRPGLIVGMLFSTIISFDELSITMFLIGPHFTTLPVKIFSELQDNASPLVAAVATILIILTTLIILLVNRFFGVELFVDSKRSA